MEEDIKILEKMKADCLEASECSLASSSEGKQWKREAQAIENIIKGYRKSEMENQSYRDYLGEPPCYDNASYIPKSKVKEKIEELKIDRNVIKKEIEEAKKEKNKEYYADLLGHLQVNYGEKKALSELMEDK